MYSNGHSAGTIESGHTYKLTHGRTRSVLDLSAKDWQSIKSAAWEASDYQKVCIGLRGCLMSADDIHD